jgi:uncharacterized membrane protein YphA (DoxX/SURF4 family)
MKLALDIFGAILAFAAIGSATAKFLKVPDVMAAMDSVGVKLHQVPQLAALEVLGGLGLIVGIWNRNLGFFAAFCLVLYFVTGFIMHFIRRHKPSDYAAALGISIIAIVTTWLEIARW